MHFRCQHTSTLLREFPSDTTLYSCQPLRGEFSKILSVPYTNRHLSVRKAFCILFRILAFDAKYYITHFFVCQEVLRNYFSGVQGADRRSSGGITGGNYQAGVKSSLPSYGSITAELAPENNKRDPHYAILPDISDAEFWQSWLDKVKEFGAIPKGENPARDIDGPKKISKGKGVSRFARTLFEAGITPDEICFFFLAAARILPMPTKFIIF